MTLEQWEELRDRLKRNPDSFSIRAVLMALLDDKINTLEADLKRAGQ